jgi:hypothetical protein
MLRGKSSTGTWYEYSRFTRTTKMAWPSGDGSLVRKIAGDPTAWRSPVEAFTR